MRISRLSSGQYEAFTGVNGAVVSTRNGVSIPIEFSGYGDTHIEAIDHCLQKVTDFINLPSEKVFKSEVDANYQNEF